MEKKVSRFFLEIHSVKDLKFSKCLEKNLSIKKEININKDLPRFLYKEIGKDYNWKDRLYWDDNDWIRLISNPNYELSTIFKNEDLVGYYELIFDEQQNFEIAYFGIFKEYFGKKIGGYLLCHAIENSFNKGAKKVWVHTCTLDHPNALKNYIARGMKIFKSEELNVD